MNDDVAIDYALRAGLAWGGFTARPVMIRNRENVVLKSALPSGQSVAVRLHRQGYQTTESIRSELVWTQALAKSGFPCPQPVATQTGDLIWQDGGAVVSVINWLDADCVGEKELIYAGTESNHCALYRRIGELTAALHIKTDALALPIQPRPEWSQDGLLGPNPWWGRFWENPSLTQEESDFLRARQAQFLAYLDTIESSDYGLIHADLMQENILEDGDGLWLIDFDDAGYGYRLFDLGTALIQHWDCPYLPALRHALIDGYSTVRGVSVSDFDVQLFMVLRGFASAGWIISRASHDDPRQRSYAERALTLVRSLAI